MQGRVETVLPIGRDILAVVFVPIFAPVFPAAGDLLACGVTRLVGLRVAPCPKAPDLSRQRVLRSTRYIAVARGL